MKLELITPVIQGQVALVRVYGNRDFGYVTVAIDGKLVTALPDDSPGVPNQHRQVTGYPSGPGYNVWTQPEWQSGQHLEFTLYDSAGALQGSCSTDVI